MRLIIPCSAHRTRRWMIQTSERSHRLRLDRERCSWDSSSTSEGGEGGLNRSPSLRFGRRTKCIRSLHELYVFQEVKIPTLLHKSRQGWGTFRFLSARFRFDFCPSLSRLSTLASLAGRARRPPLPEP